MKDCCRKTLNDYVKDLIDSSIEKGLMKKDTDKEKAFEVLSKYED